MGAKSTHAFRTDVEYELRVLDVGVNPEAGYREFSERVDVVFLVSVAGRPPSGGGDQAGRPMACIAMRFDADWAPRDGATEQLLQSLGVLLPVGPLFDWERELADRRIGGRFGHPPRPGSRNPLIESWPFDQDDEERGPDTPGRRSPTDPEPSRGGRRPRHGTSLGRRGEAGSKLPLWDGDLRELIWEGEAVVSYARPAPNQAKILSAFEEEGWPAKVDDPLEPGVLRPTLRDLQIKFRGTPLSFHGDGSGEGIRWEPRKA